MVMGMSTTRPSRSALAMDQVLIGQSPPMQTLKLKIHRLAGLDITTLILGPSGSGKELVARLIHDLSHRQPQAWVAINCGAIPADLFESELFGHAAGAFTGAQGEKAGLIVSAHRGTLFLDEIGELPMGMQVKLLRVLQERLIRPVGSTTEQSVDVRIIAASHQPLQDLVRQGRFRLDLYHRLKVATIELPGLHQIKQDLPALCQFLLTKAADRLSLSCKPLTPCALNLLGTCKLDGNVRELDHLLTSALVWSTGDLIEASDLDLLPVCQADLKSISSQHLPTQTLETALQATESAMIKQALQANAYSREAAAQQLGISERSLRYRLKKYPLIQG